MIADLSFIVLHPLDAAFWGKSDEATIGWLRQSEVKHSRVAMAAFVGYCVQSNVHWPWAMTLDGTPFPSTDLSPPEQWDALPLASKLQIILFIGFLEWVRAYDFQIIPDISVFTCAEMYLTSILRFLQYSELTPGEGTTSGLVHYTKGGKPGQYPTFDAIPHSVPFNLYDPFKFSKNMSQDVKDRRLIAEVNNGRLAMLGIFGFVSAQTIPGSVPLLADIVKPYTGEVMAPFEANWSF